MMPGILACSGTSMSFLRSSSVPITTTLVIVTSVTTAVTTRWTDGAVPAPESSVASSAQALGSSVPATIGMYAWLFTILQCFFLFLHVGF